MTSPSLASPGLPAREFALPTIPVQAIVPWLLFAAAMIGALYFLVIDQGAVSVVPGSLLHEFAHDGRHLFGFPCH